MNNPTTQFKFSREAKESDHSEESIFPICSIPSTASAGISATSSLLPPPSPLPRSGSALIIAIWTVALLSILVLSFSFDAILEGRIATYVRQRQRVNYLTQSGIAIAEMLLEKQLKVSATSVATAEEDRWKAPALRIKRGQTAIIDEPLGDGMIHIEIIPEQSRWNINLLCESAQGGGAAASKKNANQTQPPGNYDLVWQQILKTAGVPDEMAFGLVESWNDWTDLDSTITGRDGAEDEYYKQETDPKTGEPRIPYAARNGPIDTVAELRLVKGFTYEILEGGILNPEEKRPDQQIVVRGIKELFTTYGDGKINVNAAPREVLMTIPDMDDITAGAIIEEREGRGMGVGSRPASATSSKSSKTATGTTTEEEDFSFKTVSDFMSRIPGIPTSVQQYVDVKSKVFRLNIEGRSAGISHCIVAIAELNGEKVRYLRWREDP